MRLLIVFMAAMFAVFPTWAPDTFAQDAISPGVNLQDADSENTGRPQPAALQFLRQELTDTYFSEGISVGDINGDSANGIMSSSR